MEKITCAGRTPIPRDLFKSPFKNKIKLHFETSFAYVSWSIVAMLFVFCSKPFLSLLSLAHDFLAGESY